MQPGEFSTIAKCVQSLFGMKNPYPSTGKIVSVAPNSKWLMYCLRCLAYYIENPTPKMKLKTPQNKWAFLDWMLPNVGHSIDGDAVAWDDNKEVDAWAAEILDDPAYGAPDMENFKTALMGLINNIGKESGGK